MIRSFNADAINVLVNDPSIRPHVGGKIDQPLDLAPVVADIDNVFLLGEHGGYAFIWTAPRTYEVHTFIKPSGRGRWAFRTAREVLTIMASTGARLVWTRVTAEASHTRTFALKAGFKAVGARVADLGAGPVTFDVFEWSPECL